MRQFLKFTLASMLGTLLIGGVLILIFIVALTASLASSLSFQSGKPTAVKDHSVLHMTLEQEVVDRGRSDELMLDFGPFKGMGRLGLDQILDNLEKAKRDDRVKGIYLDLGMMNMGMGAMKEVRDKLIEFREESGKPVVAYADWYTQGTYYLASAADEVYLQPQGDLDFRGLLLAGMIIGALGALDDMTVTQSSVVAELRAANPDMSFSELFRAASRVGRDHISSTVNTLALAYAGAALPLLLVFVGSQVPLSRVLASEVVATEIVRTLVGSIGLVASVPLTTALAARIVSGRGRGTERAPEERPTTPDGSAPSAAVPVSGDAGDPDPESGGGQGGPPEDDPDPDWSGYLEQHEP